jgi:hypothetical protein
VTIIRDEDLIQADPHRVNELYGHAIQHLIDPPPAKQA